MCIQSPRASLARLDSSNGRRPRTSGLLRGMGVEALAGGVVGAVAAGVQEDDNIGPFTLGGTGSAGGIVLGAGVGYLLGGVVGALRPGEAWRRVAL